MRDLSKKISLIHDIIKNCNNKLPDNLFNLFDSLDYLFSLTIEEKDNMEIFEKIVKEIYKENNFVENNVFNSYTKDSKILNYLHFTIIKGRIFAHENRENHFFINYFLQLEKLFSLLKKGELLQFEVQLKIFCERFNCNEIWNYRRNY